MDVLSGLLHGFSVALQPTNLFWCFVGCFLGTLLTWVTMLVMAALLLWQFIIAHAMV